MTRRRRKPRHSQSFKLFIGRQRPHHLGPARSHWLPPVQVRGVRASPPVVLLGLCEFSPSRLARRRRRNQTLLFQCQPLPRAPMIAQPNPVTMRAELRKREVVGALAQVLVALQPRRTRPPSSTAAAIVVLPPVLMVLQLVHKHESVVLVRLPLVQLLRVASRSSLDACTGESATGETRRTSASGGTLTEIRRGTTRTCNGLSRSLRASTARSASGPKTSTTALNTGMNESMGFARQVGRPTMMAQVQAGA